MSKKIFHKIVFSLFLMLLIPSFSYAQDSLDYYFDDSGASRLRGELSIDAAKFIDLSISPKFECYLNEFLSLSVSATYSYGDFIHNRFFLMESVFGGMFGGRRGFYFLTDKAPQSIGYEAEFGVAFSNLYNNNNMKIVLNYGYLYYGNSFSQLSSQYVSFSPEFLLIEKDRFFMSLDIDFTFMFDVMLENKYTHNDIVVGYGLNVGFKL